MMRHTDRGTGSRTTGARAKASARERGAWAEELACRFLSRHGLALAARNFRCRRGEIDLVMQDSDTLVFVEVRYRGRSDFGTPAESVNEVKQRKLIAAAELYLVRHRRQTPPCRFDVVSITPCEGRAKIEWIRDAFRA